MGTGEPPILGPGQSFMTRLRGWVFSAFMLLSALFGQRCTYLRISMLRINLHHNTTSSSFILESYIVEKMHGSTSRSMGHNAWGVFFLKKTSLLLIFAFFHFRLDWLFFWNALYKMDPWLCTSEKISLKGILKYIPGAGWAMGCNSYIFLDRSFETDRTKLDAMLNYYASTGYNYQLLLFPEGTDKCPKATERSNTFARRNGLAQYNYVLHPRTTGFVHIVQNMRKANYIKYLYDVCIGFGDCIVQSETDLVSHGVSPKDVHYQVRKINIDNLPIDDEDLAQWLVDLWKDKEDQLRKFYSMKPDRREFENTRNGHDYEVNETTWLLQLFIIALWIFITFFWVTAFLQNQIMFLFFMFSCLIFGIIQTKYGGVEWLAIKKFNEAYANIEVIPTDSSTAK
uniref:PlsC domain-containing protein n=1 Tax=Heterorhabditis bacteriophora TaxID=37862 RepID=A0A1I7XHZ5_HETBA